MKDVKIISIRKKSYWRKLDPVSRGMAVEHTFVEPYRPAF